MNLPTCLKSHWSCFCQMPWKLHCLFIQTGKILPNWIWCWWNRLDDLFVTLILKEMNMPMPQKLHYLLISTWPNFENLISILMKLTGSCFIHTDLESDKSLKNCTACSFKLEDIMFLSHWSWICRNWSWGLQLTPSSHWQNLQRPLSHQSQVQIDEYKYFLCDELLEFWKAHSNFSLL